MRQPIKSQTSQQVDWILFLAHAATEDSRYPVRETDPTGRGLGVKSTREKKISAEATQPRDKPSKLDANPGRLPSQHVMLQKSKHVK